MITGAADKTGKQVEVVLLDHSMEAQFGDHVHLIGAPPESDPVGGHFGVEVVGTPVESQEQLFGREGRFDHNSGRRILENECSASSTVILQVSE